MKENNKSTDEKKLYGKPITVISPLIGSDVLLMSGISSENDNIAEDDFND